MFSLNDILSNPLEYYSPVEVAGALKIAKSTIDIWLRKRKIQSKKVGDVRLVKGEWVNDYLKSINVDGLRHISQFISDYHLSAPKDEKSTN